LNRLKEIPKLSEVGDLPYKVATECATATKFIDLISSEVPRYKGNKDLAKKEMRLLYSSLGKEWYQRARQAEALRSFAKMRDDGMEESVAITAAKHWAETCWNG
jgi:hypothetical protein